MYLCAIDVWGRWIARCGTTRKRQRWCTIRSVPLLQEVVRYAVKQYFYKIEKCILKIVTRIIEMIYCCLYIMCSIISS
jgi:hypothetical protein